MSTPTTEHPMMDFRRCVAVWFIGTGPEHDCLAALTPREEGGFSLRYRFRDEDGKRWWEVPIVLPLERAIRMASFIFATGAKLSGHETVHQLTRGELNAEQWLKKILAQPWAHVVETNAIH